MVVLVEVLNVMCCDLEVSFYEWANLDEVNNAKVRWHLLPVGNDCVACTDFSWVEHCCDVWVE